MPRRWLPLSCLALSFASAGTAPAAPAPPQVVKVEPPNWWPGHTINPVRLLLRGKDLHGARVEAADGLSVGLTSVSAAGTSLFVDIAIDPQAPPGVRRLRVRTAAGVAEAPFEVSAPLPRNGRFAGFSPDDVIYLLMPDRFANGDPHNDDPAVSRGLFDRRKARYYHGGDLQGVIDHLPYLKDLGVTAVWLNPVYQNTDKLNLKETYDGQGITDYHGYGAVDFYGVEEHFGDMAKLRELVDTAHRLGLKVIQDQVANHTGPYHPWVADPPTPTWFNGTAAHHLANTWQLWTLMDPHASAELRRATLSGWFIDILPDLNQDDPEQARYAIQNSLWWVGMTGFDAIRQDTLPYAPRYFWRDWTSALQREYPALTVVGEMWDEDPVLVSYFQGGRALADGIDTGVDYLFDFPLYFPLRRAFAEGKPLRELPKMLGRDRLYVDPQKLVTFLGLHDVIRFMSEPGASVTGLKLAYTFLLTARGIPLVYYGDELAMPGSTDPDNRRDFPGGFPGDPRDAFTAAGRTPEEQGVVAHLQRLTRLRAAHLALRRGATRDLLAGEQTWAYLRQSPGDAVLVAFNNGTQPATLDVEASGFADGARLIDALEAAPSVDVRGGRIQLTLPPRSAAVYTAAP